MSVTTSRFPPVEEMIHGVLVRDPHRWLEDGGSAETGEWIHEQRQRCDSYFAGCKDLPAIRKRVQEYLDVEVVDQPVRTADRYFYRRRTRGQEQGCIYVRNAIGGDERLLLDPGSEGPFDSIGIHRVSADGALLAYERKLGGEDRRSIEIVDTGSGISLHCAIERGYARGFVFAAANQGFYYCHETGADAGEHVIRFHPFEKPEPERVVFRLARSRGSRLILIGDAVHLGAIWVHEENGERLENLWIAQQLDPVNWRPVFANKRVPFSPFIHVGRLFALSYEEAPNGKFVELNHDGKELNTIIPESAMMIRQIVVTRNHVAAASFENTGFSVRCCSLTGESHREIPVPREGTVRWLPNLGDGSSIFLSYESYSQRPEIFEYIPDLHVLRVWYERPLKALTSLNLQRTTYRSQDGTEIPITLVGRHVPSALRLPVPVMMTSYGGFGVPTTPQFSVLVTLLLKCGVLLAFPHIRGGGEFGQKWHDGGRKRARQSSFDDFVAAAQWLCREGMTTPSQLGIFGGSNSGLLVGAAMTQRPDLFRAVLCIAPLLDMVRYEHFDQAARWGDEYGTCANRDDFHALLAYSPYHGVRDGVGYPSVLFISGDKDDRCNPAHARKMAARLQENSAQTAPVLIDYTAERGHSPALPLYVRIEGLSRRLAFLCRELNLSFPVEDVHEAACD